jgi:divinyl protochlorophyllide a 8-vinyl-reductase
VTGPALIGPNAVTQLVAALEAAGLARQAEPVFAAAGVADWLTEPPTEMVDERPVVQLHQGMRTLLPPGVAVALMQDAGHRTANYLLANRIPPIAQAVLHALPPRLAASLLVPAIRAHAWTFAGSGVFQAKAGSPTVFVMTGNPLCAGEHAGGPVCAWHAAVFERLFQALVCARARVTETACAGRGDACCRFVVDWRRVAPAAPSLDTAAMARPLVTH